MFFPDRIISIKDTDRVLEVGPGGTPFYRSDVLLEKVFDEADAREQRGHTEPLKTEKEIVFYEGDMFPFKDKEFDYVICSHVLEHIPSNDMKNFVSELERVAKKGYLEFPTIYYDYIYNFPKHLTFLLYENGVIKYLGKEDTALDLFLPVQQFFYHSASAGHTSLTNSLKDYFFQGFEWEEEIQLTKVDNVQDVAYGKEMFSKIIKAQEQNVSCKQKLKNKIKSFLRLTKYFLRVYFFRDKFLLAHKKWVADKGDTTFRMNYDLNPESIVFDLGGYEGDFADKIFNKYKCNVYIFEPVEQFYENICEKFLGNEKIKVFNFGLSDVDKLIEINLSEDGSSVFINTGLKEKIKLKDIALFLENQNIPIIDLMKINIEGGEYQVIPALIKNGHIKNIRDIQVQFHDFIENANAQRNEIRNRLKETHYLTYDYWFVWENWRLKDK